MKKLLFLMFFIYLNTNSFWEKLTFIQTHRPKEIILSFLAGILPTFIFGSWLMLEPFRIKRKKDNFFEKNRLKDRLLLLTTELDIIAEFKKNKRDARPYVLTGNAESRDFSSLSEKQKKYLDCFKKRRLSLISIFSIEKKHVTFLKAMQCMYWQKIYRKIHNKNPLTKNKISNMELLEYSSGVLAFCGIHPNGILIKKLSDKHKDFAEGLAQLPVKIYPGNYLQTLGVLMPVIALNMDKLISSNDYHTLLHEIGHIYLCHGCNSILVQNSNYQKKLNSFLSEVEADCILAILKKEYAEKVLKFYCDILNKIFMDLKEDMYFNNVDPCNQLTYIQNDADRPSFFERFLHVVDVCTQVWDLDILNFINNPFCIQYIDELLKNSFKKNDILNPRFFLEIERITIDKTKQLFYSINEETNFEKEIKSHEEQKKILAALSKVLDDRTWLDTLAQRWFDKLKASKLGKLSENLKNNIDRRFIKLREWGIEYSLPGTVFILFSLALFFESLKENS